MNLSELFQQQSLPGSVWDGRYKIPWDEPDFSRRMLDLHLSQEHDWASRRLSTIEAHVDWIHRVILKERRSRILDLGCGPGLYAERLAALGHTCRGIDFSPASVQYAREHSTHADRCEFILGDLRTVDLGDDYDLAVMIFGEVNAFSPPEIGQILRNVRGALHSGGQLLVEAHTFEELEGFGRAAASWYKAESGLFSDQPHICLTETHWLEAERVAQAEYFIIDAASADVRYYRNTLQAYSPDEYGGLLADAGFSSVRTLPAWGAAEITPSDPFVLLHGIAD